VILEVPEEPLPGNSEEIVEGCLRHKTKQWTAVEDARLLAGIRKHGLENWSSVARFVGSGRSRSQCSQRWQRGLDPRISRSPWTAREDTILRSLVAQYGEKSWIRVSTELWNRSDVQCRYRYMQLQKMRPRRAANGGGRAEAAPPHDIPVPIVSNPKRERPEEPESPTCPELFAMERLCLDLGTQSTSEIFWMLHS
jgi:hypothetical protein